MVWPWPLFGAHGAPCCAVYLLVAFPCLMSGGNLLATILMKRPAAITVVLRMPFYACAVPLRDSSPLAMIEMTIHAPSAAFTGRNLPADVRHLAHSSSDSIFSYPLPSRLA